MALPQVFNPEVAQQLINRINKLTPESKPQWGTMNASQMLAHCNVTYEYVFNERADKPNFLVKWMLKKFVKKKVVDEIPYEKNIRTAPAFIVPDNKNFDKEKARLEKYINRVVELGEQAFQGKESNSFGVLTIQEWNNMMYKHLDHHLNQFGV
ncbi:MAG: DUF1569 domain-containing protein [Chitinophagales bacterium]